MAEQGQIVIPITFDVSGIGAPPGNQPGTSGGIPNSGTPNSIIPSSKGSFAQGISAQILVSNATRLLALTGNEQLASSIRQGSEIAFLGIHAITSANPYGAIITLVTKAAVELGQAISEYKAEQRKAASDNNERDIMKMRSGMIVINANSVVSVDKYGRRKITDRR